MLDLQETIAELAARYPTPPESLTDPLAILAHETVGYLIDDPLRGTLFAELKARVGIDPAALLHAPQETLLDITRRGGMHPDKRAERLREIGRIALVDCAGDLPGALAALPTPKARALLKRFPAVGDSGADRILLFGGFAVVPAVDSNGLRAMARMGFCLEAPSWQTTYRAAVHLLSERGEMSLDWLTTAYLVLREHGKTLCRRSAPDCLACPLDGGCAHAVTSGL
jgi:endonuclease III